MVLYVMLYGVCVFTFLDKIMDISYEIDSKKKCFKLPLEAFGNFNLKYYESSAYTVFWNKYQIFIYDDLSFESPKIVIPEFIIVNLIILNNYLICLDDNGTIHLTPLKFKHSVQKKFKSSFQPREKDIKCIQLFNEHTICIKSIANTLYICTHKITNDFQIDTQVKLLFDNAYAEQLQLKPWIIHVYLTSLPEYDQIKSLYKLNEIWKDHAIVLISFDRKSIYSVLYSNKTFNEVLQPIKLYSCPSKIINMSILKNNGLSVLLSLNIGTVIKIPLNKATNDIKIVHLNTGLYRSHATEDNTIIYTDGNTMWKSEKSFSDCIKFKKCFVKHVRDFVVIGDKLLCTTFSHLIYLFSIEDTSVFEDVSKDAYCPADEVLNNSDCLSKIINEVEKSNEIVKKIKIEETYITTLSLSNRHDIMDNVINYHASVFETFDDIPKEDLTLIANINEYYDMNILNFLISISTKPLEDKFNELLSNMFGNLKIQLVFSSGTHSIKTVVVNVLGQLKKINIAVPFSIKNLNKVIIDVKLITSITEVFDTSQNVWVVLHSKKVYLNSENFIKTYPPTSRIHFTENNVCIDDTIYKSIVDHFGHLYKFYRKKNDKLKWTFYAKLAINYEKLLNNETYLNKCFNKRKAEILLKQITSTDFVNSKIELIFYIACDKVYVEIINDGFTKPILKVSCNNLEKAFHIRNFLSQLMHNNFIEFETEKEFVDHALYSTIEKLDKTIKEAINRVPFSSLELTKLFEKFQKNVIGKLPI